MNLKSNCIAAECLQAQQVNSELSASEINEAVHSLLAHPSFTKSNRLRELFLFLKDHYIATGGVPLKADDIAFRFFNRPESYSEADDPIVRTNISRLRTALLNVNHDDHRLKHIFEIPSRSYTLVITRKSKNTKATFSPLFSSFLLFSIVLNIIFAGFHILGINGW